MVKCANCGTRILFGGKQVGDIQFCSDKCMQSGILVPLFLMAEQIPEDVVTKAVSEVFHGRCPKCNGPGPVDIFNVYWVRSAGIVTSHGKKEHLCCYECGKKAQRNGIISSLLLGWWGFPWGFIYTPIQIIKNIKNISSTREYMKPSLELAVHLRLLIASRNIRRFSEPGGNMRIE